VRLVAAESFTNPATRAGTVYKACGFTAAGATAGYELAVQRYLRQLRHSRGHAGRLATTSRSARSGRTYPGGGPRGW
jgi:hypothetical protein